MQSFRIVTNIQDIPCNHFGFLSVLTIYNAIVSDCYPYSRYIMQSFRIVTKYSRYIMQSFRIFTNIRGLSFLIFTNIHDLLCNHFRLLPIFTIYYVIIPDCHQYSRYITQLFRILPIFTIYQAIISPHWYSISEKAPPCT